MKVRHWLREREREREREINLKTVELLKIEVNWTIEEARKKKTLNELRAQANM